MISNKGLIIIFLQILVLCVTMYIIISQASSKNGKMYDCSIAEISPDYPIRVKEECRKLNVGKTS